MHSFSSSTKTQLNCVLKYIDAIAKLIGVEFVDLPKVVKVEIKYAENFVKFLAEKRPQERQKVHGNNFRVEYGLLNNDAAFLRNCEEMRSYSIEIKPKQGWHLKDLPLEARETLGYDSSKSLKCRFCAMQYLKVNDHNECIGN